MAKVSAITKLVAAEGRFDELLAQVDGLVAAAAAEEGTEIYFVSRATREADTLFVFELFRDRDALREHARASAATGAALAPLLASTEIVLGEPIAGTGLAF